MKEAIEENIRPLKRTIYKESNPDEDNNIVLITEENDERGLVLERFSEDEIIFIKEALTRYKERLHSQGHQSE